MMIALYLWQKRAPQNADANVLKSQQYLLQAVQVDTDSELQRIKDVQLKHASILNLLEGSSPLVSQAQALNQLVESLMQP
jgi:hypothetical protein